MSTPSPNNVLLGRGEILFSRHTGAGVFTKDFRHLGNCDSFEITPDITTLDLTNYMNETSAPYASKITKTDLNLSLGGFEADPDNVALALLGDTSDFTQTTASPTAEVLVPAAATNIKGKFFRTALRKITAVVLTQGADTLVLGTDYEIYDAAMGLIHLLPTSPSIEDGANVTIAYTGATILAGAGAKKIQAVTNSSIQGSLLYRPNNSDGPKRDLIAWKVSLQPGNAFALISDEYWKFTLSGKVLSDSAGQYGGSLGSPYFTQIDVI